MLYRFGVFELDARTGELRKSGVRIKLGGQPLAVLTLLVERAGDLVTRDELQEALWKEDTFTDFDHGVNTAVQRIRRTLDDSATSPRFIETLTRKGYRFIAPVETSPARPYGERPGSRIRKGTLAAALGLLALLALTQSGGSGRLELTTPTPFTSYPGVERYASFSPDASQAAFEWIRGGASDVYVKVVGDDSQPTRLTQHPGKDTSPRWSPDGRWIAFLRVQAGGRAELMAVSPHGGPPRRVAGTAAPTSGMAGPYLAWATDSSRILAVDREAADRPFHLVWVDFTSGRKEPLTSPPITSLGDTGPALSADGSRLAFSRVSAGAVLHQGRLGVAGELLSEPAPVPTPFDYNHSPAWLDSDRVAIVSAKYFGFHSTARLYSLALSSGKTSPLLRAGRISYPSFAADGSAAAYSLGSILNQIYALNLAEEGTSPRPFEPSTLGEFNPQFSPDGSKVAFVSRRGGRPQYWVADLAAGQAFAVTDGSGRFSWAPDGSRIVFHKPLDGRSILWSADVRSGAVPRPLRGSKIRGSNPYLSRHGHGVYFDTALDGGTSGVFRLPAEGATPIRLADDAANPTESTDGRYVYYSRRGYGVPLSIVPSAGGAAEVVVREIYMGLAYATTSKGVFYASAPDRDGMSAIRFRNESTGDEREILRIPAAGWLDMDVSPDGRTLLFTQSEDTTDLMIAELSK